LTTSREQLNLQAEWSFEVQGLPIPSSIDFDHLESYSSAALFIERAKRMKQNFSPAADQLESIKRICQLVEGSPLGLELAATWVRVMSIQEIAREIEQSMDFLTTAARDAPKRHRSIRAVFDYSWNLLSDEERRVLARLSVFRGGFTRTAAKAVAGATLHHLSALVHKSLLRHTEDQAGRYDIHELIRQYTALKLRDDAEASDQAHDCHASHFASWLRLQEARLEDSQLQEAITHIGLEIDNLRCAWDWMVAHRQVSNLQGSLISLFVLHDIRNWLHQGSDLFEQALIALELPEEMDENRDERTILLGELMACQGHMRWHLGEMQNARDLLQRSLKLLSAHRGRAMLAEALLYLSILEHSRGDFGAARRLAEECVSLNREQGRVSGTGYALSNLAMVCLTQGEYQTAYTCLKESLQMMRSIDHARGTAVALTRLAAAALRLGRISEAQEFLDESLEIARKFNDRWGIGNALNYLGLLADATGDLERAESLLRESVTLFKEDGDQILLASTLTDLGYILNDRNSEPDSLDTFQQGLQIARRIGAIPIAHYASAGIATLHAKTGSAEKAFELAAYIWSHPSSNQQAKERAGKLCEELESRLTPEQIEAARARAQVLRFESILEGLGN
jgi:predicted ATPase/Flp pilus assembly protein TadD